MGSTEKKQSAVRFLWGSGRIKEAQSPLQFKSCGFCMSRGVHVSQPQHIHSYQVPKKTLRLPRQHESNPAHGV